MRLIHYCNNEASPGTCRDFAQIMQRGLPGWNIVACESMENLVQTLRTPFSSSTTIVILHLQDERETEQILNNRELFKGLEIVLILPEDPGMTGVKTWLIEPRISFFGTPSAGSMCAILTKMADRVNRRPQLMSLEVWRESENATENASYS